VRPISREPRSHDIDKSTCSDMVIADEEEIVNVPQ
jgi:hypothetical protein